MYSGTDALTSIFSRASCDNGEARSSARAVALRLPPALVETPASPNFLGRLASQAVVWTHQDNTRYGNGSRPVLPGTGPAAPAPVRGAAGLLRRRRPVGRGGPPVRLPARGLPGPLLALPAPDGPGLLPREPARAEIPAPQGRGAHPRDCPAQAQLLRLRHPRRTRPRRARPAQ